MNEKARKYYWYTLVSYLLNALLNLSFLLFVSDGKSFYELIKAIPSFSVIIFAYCVFFYLIFYFVGKKNKMAWAIGFTFGILGMFTPQFYSAFIFITCLLFLRKFVFGGVNRAT